jgi:Flp pilus assembly protein CpaB
VAIGAPDAIAPGVRVDVLVTREGSGRGSTTLALEDVEVLTAAAAPDGASESADLPRVVIELRVSVR